MEVKHGVLLYHMFHSSVHKKKKKKTSGPLLITLYTLLTVQPENAKPRRLWLQSHNANMLFALHVWWWWWWWLGCCFLCSILSTHTHTYKKKASLVVNTDYQEDQLHRKDKKMIFFITCLEIKGSDTHLRFLWAWNCQWGYFRPPPPHRATWLAP